ncbi:MAG TPA: hypothetical protein VFW87_10780 [Pirellulales bacterium]|nr:hypothetical protein [Pirellulales bacterium]
MKTTLDLPDALVDEVKRRAHDEGRKLNDAVAELCGRDWPPPIAHRLTRLA